MKRSILFVITVMFLFAGCNTDSASVKENIYAIVPAPVSIKEMSGNFVFSKKSKIILSSLTSETKLAADFLASLVKNPTGFDIPVVEGNKAASGSVFMSIDNAVSK